MRKGRETELVGFGEWRRVGGGTLLLLVRKSQGEGMWQRVKSRDSVPISPGVSNANYLFNDVIRSFVYDANCVVTEHGKLAGSLAAATVYQNSVVFWDVTQHRLVSHRRFGTTYRAHLPQLTSQISIEFTISLLTTLDEARVWSISVTPHSCSLRINLNRPIQGVRSWLRHSVTRRKVAASIPDGVIGVFHCPNPSGRTVALGSTQPLTEMSTRDISGGKGGRCVRPTTLPPSCADCLQIVGASTVWNPNSLSRPAMGQLFTGPV
jgi:hypothetical protein